jgi:uncharacterized protein YyaL (SSP411 family)
MANRLAGEKSPYLLQHANNPVDWYPWGEEAFAAARELDRPVFLSIGYATCHWCHVMERESFEDPEVARLLNETFVNVKVDREERPDIDGIYMTVAQLTTGRGGWPLTIVMTPDRLPFLAATYIPREDRHGRVGMFHLIPRIRSAWEENRAALIESGASIQRHLEAMASADLGGRSLGEGTLREGFSELAGQYDREFGGFGAAPKFPVPHRLLFLLRYWNRTGVEGALRMVDHTLDALRDGGVFDQVGFGFHRYSTDRMWRLPHFEKMLYDQATLMLAYTEAFEATRAPGRATTVREIAGYVLRELRSPDGAFYSAEDADSEGEEGRFYVWSTDEVREVLGPDDAGLAFAAWGLSAEGNYRDEATGETTGLNVLRRIASPAELAADLQLERKAVEERLERARTLLFESRSSRERPLLDDKVLTDWNGLMIAALARAGRVTGEPDLVAAAREAAAFLHQRMWRDGGLLHRYRAGEAALEGNLDDYANLCWGELELYRATFDAVHLERAARLTDEMLERFGDSARGGFYFSPEGRSDLIVRRKDVHDGATPSGNSVALLNLLRLARLTGRTEYEQAAADTSSAFSRQIAAQPSAFAFFLTALELAVGPSEELVIVGEPGASDTRALLEVASEGYHPRRSVLVRPPGDAGRAISRLAPYTRDFELLEGRASAWLCRDFACEMPVSSPEDLRALIRAG